MTFEHARDFLFTLYASSKKGGRQNAGRFGIGFWSVLRLKPTSIVIRSRPARGPGWQVELNGALEVVDHGPAQLDCGTEVVLERPATGENLEELVRGAVLRDAPFLNRSGRGQRPLEVRVDGRRVRAEPELPPPSMVFQRRGFQGAVGLGPEPRVAVFGHGLKVRDAATLEELLLDGRSGPAGLPPSGEGLSPCALIDSRRLSLLMARGDAREDRALRQLVAVGHREIRSLVRAELYRHTRPNFAVRAWYRLWDSWSASRVLRALAAVALLFLGLGLSLVGLRWWWGPFVGSGSLREPAAHLSEPRPPEPYVGLEGRYRGPDVDTLGSTKSGLLLEYSPISSSSLFGALVITGLAADGTPIVDDAALSQSYVGQPCVEGCLEVELVIERQAGLLRLPVAAGHLVDPASVRLEGEALEVRATADGRPVVVLGGLAAGRLRYRSSPGVPTQHWIRGNWPELPPEIQVFAAGIDHLPTAERALAVEDFVRGRVRYDTGETTVVRNRETRGREPNFFARTLEVAAGDCDVQNTLAAAILDELGVSSRLVVGWVGLAGKVLPGLHAWVEYVDDDGRWRVVDASTPSRPGQASLPFDAPSGPSNKKAPVPFWLPLALVVVAGATFYVVNRSRSRSFHRGTPEDVAGLIRGAAIRPDVFGGAHALFSHPLVPLLGGRSISLGRARSETRRGRLAVGSQFSSLAARAAAVGGMVVDRERAEGEAVAEALGVEDLDRWQSLLERSLPQSVADRVEEALVSVGEPCRLRVARSVGEEIAVLDGRRFGLTRSEVWVIADLSGAAWMAVREYGDTFPAQAALYLAEVVVDRLGVPDGPRARCLAGLARAALLEQVEH